MRPGGIGAWHGAGGGKTPRKTPQRLLGVWSLMSGRVSEQPQSHRVKAQGVVNSTQGVLGQSRRDSSWCACPGPGPPNAPRGNWRHIGSGPWGSVRQMRRAASVRDKLGAST